MKNNSKTTGPKTKKKKNIQKNNAAYAWKSVIAGGGGFIPGIIYHPAEEGLVYLRTDMGGAYKWDKEKNKWLCITDMFGKDEADYNGVLSLALDPNDANLVYMMNGKYTKPADRDGAFHISKDRGNSWKRVPLPFKIGGNEKGRGAGERIAVDPHKSSIIFMGTTRDGLWRSGDAGSTWERVETFLPLDVNFVMFDRPGGAAGTAAKRIFAAAVDITGNSLQVSNDGGKKWDAVAGQPAGVMALRADTDGKNLYVAFSDSEGPNGAIKGSVWKYDILKNSWKNLNMPSGEGGFSGISVDAKNEKHILAGTLNRFHPHDEIYRSTDGGQTWHGLIENSEWDGSYAPYSLTIPPHWIADVKINPFDPEAAMFVTGYGIWACRNLSSPQVKWFFENKGVEQAVPMQIISPQKGAHLLSAMGDIDGFIHDRFDVSPRGRHDPAKGTTLAIAFAGRSPSRLVKAYNSKPPFGAYSTDGGKSWVDFASSPANTARGGVKSIAISADGKIILWQPKGAAMSYSKDNGSTWTACGGGIAQGLWPVADRVNAEKFYVYDGVQGGLFVSNDGGRNFSQGASGLPAAAGYPEGNSMVDYSCEAVFGEEGDVWIAAGRGGLFHSGDSGRSVCKIENAAEAFRIGFGKAAPGKKYPAIYLWGKVRGVTGFFRSDNGARTWVRINDDRHQYGWIHCITGDPRVYGRCYIAAEGRGIFYGEI
jgi:photosystem II stability/assembly factor-like uncharacterized protein